MATLRCHPPLTSGTACFPVAVSGCQPSIERLPELLAALNGGGQDFSGFVRALRREFQGVVAQEMQQQQPSPAVVAA